MERAKKFIFHFPLVSKSKQVSAIAFIYLTYHWRSVPVPGPHRKGAKRRGKGSFGIWPGAYVLLPHPHLHYTFNRAGGVCINTRARLAQVDTQQAYMVYPRPTGLWLFITCCLPCLGNNCSGPVSAVQALRYLQTGA